MKIHSIKLETASLDKVADFYHTSLGLEVIRAESGVVHIRIGSSWLVFKENPGLKGIYHFAINIPCNQIREGMAWLERCGIELIANEKGETQIDFPNWNAEAAYFFDPAGNIVELIARRDLQNDSDHTFGPDALYEICETGIVTDDVPAWNARVAESYGIHPFDKQKPAEEFSALGTDSGLFIVVKEGRKWFLTDLPATRVPVEVKFENDAAEIFDIREA
ncbi:MAG: hypothetical protein IPK76_24565 [Lewinellaceae bacterium]|jgi:catechol 2,3-dioxygenase-like lactoylglutathione lyase family enzyme|nr:hypothetical protein [Lewinellaceae bacterium]